MANGRDRSTPAKPVTRGGHTPTGTAADRRAKTATSGTAKSERTRQALIAAARVVFEQSGFMDARVADIVSAAGIAHGSFYTYFTSKQDVFNAVMAEVREAINEAVAHAHEDVPGDTLGNLDRANRRYLRAHRANATMLALIDQVASTDDEVRRTRRQSRQRHVARVERTIIALQNRGLADQELDVHAVAGALVSMLSSFAYWSAITPGEYDEETVAQTVTSIWARAVGLTAVEPSRSGRGGDRRQAGPAGSAMNG